MEAIIKINKLSKQYSKSDKLSLNNITFNIKKGQKIGIFGPNGAGKTTLISILCGIPGSDLTTFAANATKRRKVFILVMCNICNNTFIISVFSVSIFCKLQVIINYK